MPSRAHDLAQFALQRVPHDRVERAEGLVHQAARADGRERARDADALRFAAGEFARPAVAIPRRIEPNEFEHLVDARRRCARDPSPAVDGTTAMFCGDVHVREETDRLDCIADACGA